MKNENSLEPFSGFVLYTSPAGDVKLEVFLNDETLWLNMTMLAELFDTSKQNISYHLQNIFAEGELLKNQTVKEILTVQKEGGKAVKRSVEFYNLDTVIAVGYRVNSARATQFRIWATQVLKEYIIKGFAMNDERLKQGESAFGKDYFKELLERIRSIRASERRIYLRRAVLTMILNLKSQRIFLRQYRINFIMPSPAIRRRKLFTRRRTEIKQIWDLPLGKTGLRTECLFPM